MEHGGECRIAKTITLIRHAETNANNERRWQGSLDSGLSERGLDQVARLGVRFRSDRPSRVVASDLNRTMETAAAIADDPYPDPAWREFHVGAWEGMTTQQISEQFPGELEAFFAGEDVAPGGGELMSDFADRIVGAFDALVASMRDGETAHVVTHGGVIWTLLSRFLGRSGRRAPLSISYNTAVSVITVADAEPPQLTVFNDATHLEEAVVHFGPRGNVVSLFRHGESEGNVLGRWQGHTDSPLSALGLEQATAAAPGVPAIGQLFSSPLGRAFQTAEILAEPRGLTPILDDGFKEMAFGAWENLTPDEARLTEPETFTQIYERGIDLPRGGDGETFCEAGKRMSEAVRTVVEHAECDIGVVSHGAIIRA
ncbi:MAG: histidine phosphatase family protein, partial [Acidimicrobiia bacterium]